MNLPVISRAVVFAVMLASAPAFAQQPAAEPAMPQQAGTPGAAIPASQFAAARDVVIASGLSRSFQGTVAELSQQLETTVTRTRPDLTADLNAVMHQLAPEFALQSDAMIDNAARIYASALSEQELKDIAKFFSSPTGKRYVDFEPAIIDTLQPVMSDWSQQVSRGMMARVHEEMQKKGHDF